MATIGNVSWYLHLSILARLKMGKTLFPRIAGTRLHGTNVNGLPDLNWLNTWCEHVLCYSEVLIIAADSLFYQPVNELLTPYKNNVKIILVEPWLSATFSLNLLVEYALYLGTSELLLQSSELWVEPVSITMMSKHLTTDTLVVGARVHKSHATSTGILPLESANSPWNTLALWQLPKLGKTGFLTVSSGLIDTVPGGMEEVATISLLQSIDLENHLAKIVTVPGIHWACYWTDPMRIAFHEEKMLSKTERAERQLDFLGISRGIVTVLE